ncbi:MAG: hypothetical protein EOO43_24905 [Flavobacterium sp.]|nr:MAG: hypothetical protein EOO43_24905 [Flavobacterium sp.]
MNTLLRASCIGIMVMGVLIFLAAVMGADKLIIAGFIFLFMSSLGFIYPNSTALAMAETGANSGTASALLGSLQMFVSFIISVVVSLLFLSVSQNL